MTVKDENIFPENDQIELISVSQAIRKYFGRYKVKRMITNPNWNKKTCIGKQLRIFQDLQDVVLEINTSKILATYFLRLKVSPRYGWNSREINRSSEQKICLGDLL